MSTAATNAIANPFSAGVTHAPEMVRRAIMFNAIQTGNFYTSSVSALTAQAAKEYIGECIIKKALDRLVSKGMIEIRNDNIVLLEPMHEYIENNRPR